MRTKCIIASLLLCCVFTSGSPAQSDRDFGVGVILGEPIGISLNKFVAPKRSLDAGIAWSFTENESFQLHADYLFHRFDRLNVTQIGDRVPLYYGLGLRVKFKSDDDNNEENNDDEMIGIRIPIGITYLLDDQPIEFFAELVPILDVSPDMEFNLNAAFGARYYF